MSKVSVLQVLRNLIKRDQTPLFRIFRALKCHVTTTAVTYYEEDFIRFE